MEQFSITWKIAGINHSKDFSTRRNIKKPVIFPRYKGNIGDFDTVSAYVGSTEINPISGLSVIRTEDSVLENSRVAFSTEQSWRGNVGYTSARYFLLTDVVGEYVSRKKIPFYWKHVLPSADIDPKSVAVLDLDLNEVDTYSYVVVRTEARDVSDNIISGSYESCAVFSNYINSYDKDSGNLKIYFVRYSVSGSTHYQILNSQSAFSEATTDDVSLVTGRLKTWRKVYIITTSSSLFTISVPNSITTYYLKPLERSRIIVKEPSNITDTNPWFLSVSNGSLAINRNSVPYIYSIPEFSLQTFSPLYPYKVEAEEIAEWLRPDIIKINRTPMQVDDHLYKMEILVRNAKNQTLYALTTDPAKHGLPYEEAGERIFRTIETNNTWITWDSYGIIGWDAESGFIHLQREYSDTHYFHVTYYYKETRLEITSLNVNPIFDESYADQFYVLYIIPIGGENNNNGQTVSVQYIKVDRSGRVVETSQDGVGGNLDLSSIINVGQQYMYYSLSASSTNPFIIPSGQGYIDLADTTEWPSSGIVTWIDSALVRHYESYNRIVGNRIYFETFITLLDQAANTEFRLHSFVEPYTTNNQSNAYQWLILAEVHAVSASRVDELSIIDLRVSGGLVKDKYRNSALSIDPRAIWARPEIITSRGQPIPGDSAAVIKLPYTLLKEFGGNFTIENIEAIIAERHLAVGVIPIILFHGAIPEIESLVSTTSSIVVTWYSEGTSYSYNIYRASTSSGPWILVNDVPFSDQAYGNSYTIEGLTSGLIYYISVSTVSSNGIEGPKGTPWGIKVKTS